MTNIKKIFLFAIFSFFFLNYSHSAIKDSLFATISNKAITNADIMNEIKVILIVNGESYSEENKEQLHTAAVKAAVKRTIKKIEIEKYEGLIFNEKDLNQEINKMATEQNMDVETFKNVFISNGISFDHIIDRMKTELQWNSLIFKLYSERLSINNEEIEDQIKLILEKKYIEEYLISEIIVSTIPENSLETEIQKIKNKIKNQGFEKTAIELSISETSIKGGNLGWINENTISDSFKKQIMNTDVGNISDPIFLPQGILFFKVRDKRKVEQNIDIEYVKDQLVNAEKTKILNMYSLSHYQDVKRSLNINYY